MKKELRMEDQGQIKCYFCGGREGQMLFDSDYHLFHLNCLAHKVKQGDFEAKRMAFNLGNKPSDLSLEDSERLSARAKRIFFDPSLSVTEAVGLGMISQFALKHGEAYFGYSKFAEIGIWDSKERCFHLFSKTNYKAGYFYRGRFDTQFIPMYECL